MNSLLRHHLSSLFKEPILNLSAVSGGDISDAACIETRSRKYFLKYNSKSFLDNFQSEADGLNTLRGKSILSIPEIDQTGFHGEYAYLVMEFIPAAQPSSKVHRELGYGLAQLHKNTQPQFGYTRDNYIGSLPQLNNLTVDWASFYGNHRLLPLFRQGYDSGLFDSTDHQHLSQLIIRLEEICPKEPPSLIHGDLWSGNWMASFDKAYLIDPSVSYAHRELDLAMTKLFGGFTPLFYDSYQEVYPLEPNFEERESVYQLYYLLVHAILFRGGYISSVKRILSIYGG